MKIHISTILLLWCNSIFILFEVLIGIAFSVCIQFVLLCVRVCVSSIVFLIEINLIVLSIESNSIHRFCHQCAYIRMNIAYSCLLCSNWQQFWEKCLQIIQNKKVQTGDFHSHFTNQIYLFIFLLLQMFMCEYIIFPLCQKWNSWHGNVLEVFNENASFDTAYIACAVVAAATAAAGVLLFIILINFWFNLNETTLVHFVVWIDACLANRIA